MPFGSGCDDTTTAGRHRRSTTSAASLACRGCAVGLDRVNLGQALGKTRLTARPDRAPSLESTRLSPYRTVRCGDISQGARPGPVAPHCSTAGEVLRMNAFPQHNAAPQANSDRYLRARDRENAAKFTLQNAPTGCASWIHGGPQPSPLHAETMAVVVGEAANYHSLASARRSDDAAREEPGPARPSPANATPSLRAP